MSAPLRALLAPKRPAIEYLLESCRLDIAVIAALTQAALAAMI